MIRQTRFEDELKLRPVERCSCGYGLQCSDACSSYESRKICPAYFKELMHPSMNVVVKTVTYRKRYENPGKPGDGFKLEEDIQVKYPSKKDRRKMKRVKKNRDGR